MGKIAGNLRSQAVNMARRAARKKPSTSKRQSGVRRQRPGPYAGLKAAAQVARGEVPSTFSKPSNASAQKKSGGGGGSLGERMFNQLRQTGKKMSLAQAKFNAMNEQRAGGKAPSLGKRGSSPQPGDRSLARAQRERGMMRGGPSRGKRGGRMAQRMGRMRSKLGRMGMMQRRPGMGKRGAMRMQGGMGGMGRTAARLAGGNPAIGRGATSSVPDLGGGAAQEQGNQQVAQRIPAPGVQPSTPMTPMQPPMQPMTPPMAPPMQPPVPPSPMLARNPRRRFSLSNPYGA